MRAQARPGPDAPSHPPAAAVLRSAHLTGSLTDHAVLISAEFSVDALADGWAELPLTLDPKWLGAVTVDGSSALSASSGAAVLVVHGAGRHAVRIDFAVPVATDGGSRSITLRSPGTAEATLALTAPESLKLESRLPFTREQETVTFALPAGPEDFQITWSAGEAPPIETAGVFQEMQAVYALDAAHLRADLALSFHSALKPVPGTLSLPLPPGTEVLAVDGPELSRWSLAGDRLLAELLPGPHRQAEVRVHWALPLPEAVTRVDLPAPVADGTQRASGSFTLLAHHGLRVRRVETGALMTRDDSQAPPGLSGRDDFAGTWVFPVLRQAPAVEIERLTPRFTATLDTQVTLSPDAVHFTRHLSFQPREGSLFSPTIDRLLDGERIDSVQRADGGAIDWRPIDGGAALHTPAGTKPGESLNVVVTSTLRPPAWDQLDSQPVALGLTSARLPGAEKVTGYVALASDDALRVATPKSDGLEPRDPRQFAGRLPLSGHLAWFRLDDFQLDLVVSQRPVEFDATVALDVLPLANSLELEGQIGVDVTRGGLKELTVAFPGASASAVRWDSPLIAEKVLGEDGRWTLKFHQKLAGVRTLRFHASLPLADAADAGTTERRFSASVPFPAIPAARRLTGTLVVEANTDTELSLVPQALDDLDVRQAPAIEGYAPRHRLVAGYSWRGGQPALALNGVRHRPGELAAIVVDSLALDSVVSTDGPTRHQAVLAVRSAGAQFLDLLLPPGARVLSAVVDSQATKPIRGPGGSLRLPLGGAHTALGVIYETPAQQMKAVTRTTLPPLGLDPKIPILQTTWRLHLPEGFSYTGFETNLSETTPAPRPPSLAQAFADSPLVASLVTPRHSARVLLEIERPSGVTAGDFFDPISSSKAAMSSNTSLPTEFNIITSKETLAPVIKKRNLVEKWRLASIDEAYDKLSRMVDTGEEPGSDLVRIEVKSPDAVEARDLANDVAEAYIARRKQIENERVQLAFQTLSHTRKAQEQEVERARTRMLGLVEDLGIVDLNAMAPLDFRTQLEALKNKEGEDLVHAAAGMSLLDPKSMGIYTQYLEDQRSAEQLKKSGIGEDHPDVVMLKNRIEAQRTQLNEAIKTVGSSLVDKTATAEKFLENNEKLTAEQKDASILDSAKYAEYQQAKDQYGMAQEVLQKMIDEQERARVVNLMPRTPATIHDYAGEDAGLGMGGDTDARKWSVTLASGSGAKGPASGPAEASGAAILTPEAQAPEAVVTAAQATVASDLDLGMGYFDLGDFEKARDAFNRVLAVDPHNQSARRQLERTERRIGEYLFAARDHTRAKMLREVDDTWESAATKDKSRPAERESVSNAEIPGASTVEGFMVPEGKQVVTRLDGKKGATDDALGSVPARPAMRAGLVPLEFSLPEGGRMVEFRGLFAPAEISFRAESWDRQVRWAWIWMVAGALGFVLLHLRFRRPILIGLLGGLAGHFVPLIADNASWTPTANAILTGWLAAVAITLVTLALRWTSRASSGEKEVSHA